MKLSWEGGDDSLETAAYSCYLGCLGSLAHKQSYASPPTAKQTVSTFSFGSDSVTITCWFLNLYRDFFFLCNDLDTAKSVKNVCRLCFHSHA